MRNKLMGGLLALALVLAPASAANAIYEGNELHGTLSRATVKPLEVVTYTADPGTYDANEEVSFTIGGIAASTITTVLTVSELSVKSPAEADGSLVFAFYAPEAGDKDYTFTTYRADGRVWDELGFTVLGNAAVVDGGSNGNGNGGGNGTAVSSGANGGLASTGSDIAIFTISGVAVLLLAAGVVLLVVRRRRSGADSAA